MSFVVAEVHIGQGERVDEVAPVQGVDVDARVARVTDELGSLAHLTYLSVDFVGGKRVGGDEGVLPRRKYGRALQACVAQL